MLYDHVIPKPSGIGANASHQLVEELTNGSRPSFVDLGDRLIIRSEMKLTDNGQPVRQVKDGDVLAFELAASCGVKNKGRHRYFGRHDWRSRRAWLEGKAEQSGFELRAVSVSARSEKVERSGRTIAIDRSEFAGVLKVTDAQLFEKVLAEGLPGPARAFGRGMIRLA